jgi:formiminotetrahydrofolate cyclodeaminase
MRLLIGSCWSTRSESRRLDTLTTDDYLDVRLEDFLERLSVDGLAPGSGSASAITVAFAARLVAMVASCSRASWDEAPGVVAQAIAISDRAAALARTDATVWEEALTALRDAESAIAGDPRSDFKLRQKLDAAAAAPLEIASLGADAVALASLAADHADTAYRADAAAAAALAAGAARAAAHLVRVNLGVGPSDQRLARALASEQAADELAERLLGAEA